MTFLVTDLKEFIWLAGVSKTAVFEEISRCRRVILAFLMGAFGIANGDL